MKPLAQRPADAEHRLRLLTITEDAVREIGAIDPSLRPEWEARHAQVRDGLILTDKMKVWLSNHADYWQPKDRGYADYVRRLLETYRPAIDLP